MKHMTTRLGAAGTAIGLAATLVVSGIATAAPKAPNHFQGQPSSSFTSSSGQQGNQGNGVGTGSKGNTGKQAMHIQVGKILGALGLGSGGSITLNNNAVNLLKGIVASIQSNWPTTNSDPTWTPSGANWQFNFKNWNPALWEANGSSFANWSTQLDSFISSMFPSLGSQLTMIGL